MTVIDEYLAVRVVGGAWPDGLLDEEDLALPASRHWRLLQRVHAPGDGPLADPAVEVGPTSMIFTKPNDDRTEAYNHRALRVTGAVEW